MNNKIVEAYTIIQDHYKPIKCEIESYLDEIPNPICKIEYLQGKEIAYLIDFFQNPILMDASGKITAGNPQKVGLDGWIQLKIKQLKNEYSIEEKSIPKKASIINSYKWRNQDELEKLFNLMNGEFIEKCSFIQFKDAFSNKPITLLKPLFWIKRKNLLAYFIDQSYQNKKIQFHINPDKWKIARAIFSNAGSNLSQSLQDCKNNPEQKPVNYSLVDNLFKAL